MIQNQNSLAVFALASVLLLPGCVSSPRYSFPSGCEPDGEPFEGYETAGCQFPLMAVMPPLIEQEVLRLAIIHPSKNDVRGFSQPLWEEISTVIEMAAHNLKHSLPRLEIVERARIDVAIKELEFQASGHVRDDSFVGVGRMLGTDHLFIYQVTANFDRDMESFQQQGGYVRSIASGKLIRVQTGAVVFQQSARQESFVRPAPIGRTWAVPGIEGLKRGTVLLALDGLFLSLTEALLSSPIGILWNDEPGSSRVKGLKS